MKENENTSKKKILLASDHAGFELKNMLCEFLPAIGYEIEDMGPDILDPEDDFPELLTPAGFAVAQDPENVCAVVIGGSGQGEAMVMNRFPGVRAVVFYGNEDRTKAEEIIKLSREHNNANVLSFGARFITADEAKWAVELWLNTAFSGEEKYARRNDMLDTIM